MGEATIRGALISGGDWRFERVLRQPAGSANALERSLLAGPSARDAAGGSRWPDAPLLDLNTQAIAAGATGYLQKYSRPDVLLQAVLDVAEDRLCIPVQATRRVFAMLRGQHQMVSAPPLDRLTPLERETLRLFARGNSYAQIAEARGKKPVTVRNTLYRIQGKLRIETKRELVIWAARNGLMDDVVVGEDA